MQQRINEVFGGAAVLSNAGAAQMWFDEACEDPDDLQRVKNELMPWLTM